MCAAFRRAPPEILVYQRSGRVSWLVPVKTQTLLSWDRPWLVLVLQKPVNPCCRLSFFERESKRYSFSSHKKTCKTGFCNITSPVFTSFLPTCLKLLFLTPTLPPLIVHVILRRRLTLMLVLESSFCLCRIVQGFFFLSLFVSVLPRVLTWRACQCTWRARHSQPPLRYKASAFYEMSKPKAD